jgi:hypothetical protein
VKKVHVEPSSTGATVHISLATGDVAIKEMLLANPPRIVFDLKARGPIPKSDAVADAAIEAPEEPASPEKVAIAPLPTPAKVEAPKSEPIVIAAAEPAVVAEKREPPIQLEAPPSASTKPALQAAAAPPEAKRDAMPPPPTAPQPEFRATAPEPATAKPTLIPPVDREKSGAQQVPAATSIASAAEARRKAIAEKSGQASSSESLMDLAMSPIGLAAIGGVVLLLAIVVLRRRRGAEDDDPLYTVMSADDAGAGVSMDTAYPMTDATETRTPVLANLGPYESDAFEEASEPAVREYASGLHQLALGSAPEPSEPVSRVLLGGDSDSLFAAEPEVVGSAAPAIAQAYAPSPVVSQVAQISADVERRVSELERRLEQLTEARERLERQVAAQTEELRVQRAAIARTQRVVRTIAKTEDMATEPVPRA